MEWWSTLGFTNLLLLLILIAIVICTMTVVGTLDDKFKNTFD
jgi:cell division protein FtsL